jgi:Protein of unknown function (DUF2752)
MERVIYHPAMSAEIAGATTRRVRVGTSHGRQPLGLIAASASAVGILAIGLLHLDRLPISMCALKFTTGCPCPTCGTTRALGRLFARDWSGAVAMNPLATAAVFMVGLWGLVDLALLPWGRSLWISLSRGSARSLRWTVALLVLANWVYLISVGR